MMYDSIDNIVGETADCIEFNVGCAAVALAIQARLYEGSFFWMIADV